MFLLKAEGGILFHNCFSFGFDKCMYWFKLISVSFILSFSL